MSNKEDFLIIIHSTDSFVCRRCGFSDCFVSFTKTTQPKFKCNKCGFEKPYLTFL